MSEAAPLCDDCPPADYPTDKTRCLPCPRRAHRYERKECEACSGTGKSKFRAVAGSGAAVGRRKKAHCPECMGDGYITWRIKETQSPDAIPKP